MSRTSICPDVVITGIGVVSPLGASVATFCEALRSGRSGLRRESLSIPGCADLFEGRFRGAERLVGRVGDFGAAAVIDAGRRRRMPRLGQLAVVAARQALGCASDDSGAPKGPSPLLAHYGDERIGVVLGTGLGGIDLTIEFMGQYIDGGPSVASPALFPYTVMNAAGALVAMELGLKGASVTLNHRDLSAVEALGTAAELLALGRCDAVLAGGCDELSGCVVHAGQRLGFLAPAGSPTDNSGPALRPYDRFRQGFAPGEGATLFLLERRADAEARGARIYAELCGLGRGGDDRPRLGYAKADGGEITGAVAAVQASLDLFHGAELDWVAGAGNGTSLDALETRILRQALGARAETIAISSILGQTGEWQTSAGLRVLAALFALGEQWLPGTLGLTEPDPDAALPGLCNVPQPTVHGITSVLVPTFAQGGGSVSLVLGRAGSRARRESLGT